MLWTLPFHALPLLFLLFEGSRAVQLFNDGNVEINYNNPNLLITWKFPHKPSVKFHVQLICGAPQKVVGDLESVNSTDGQVTIKSISPASMCQIQILKISTQKTVFSSPLFSIPSDSPPGTPSTQISVSDGTSPIPNSHPSSSAAAAPTLSGPTHTTTSVSSSSYLAAIPTFPAPIPTLAPVPTSTLIPNSTCTSATCTSASVASSNPSVATDQHSKPIGAIVGGTVGIVLVICVLLALLYLYLRRRRRINHLKQLSRPPFNGAYYPTALEKQERFDRAQNAMAGAEKQGYQTQSKNRLSNTLQVRMSQFYHSKFMGLGGHKPSDEKDGRFGENGATVV